MNNFSFSSIQQRKTSKNGRKSPLLSTDASHFTKELKSPGQTHNITQKDNSQTNFSSNSLILLENTERFEMENYFDSMLQKMNVLPLHSAIEPILTNIYSSYKSILWISKDFKTYSFYSPTLDLHITGEDTLLAASSRAKTSILSPGMKQFKGEHINNSKTEFEQIESECSKMFFPFYLKSGNVIAVAEIMRTESQNPFDDHDLQKASFLIKKFLLYGSALFNPSETVFYASEFSHIAPPNNLYQRLSSPLIRGFNCKMVDFWCHHNNSKDILKLDSGKGEFIQPPRSNIGVVISAIRNKTSLNEKCPRYHPNFSFNGDPLPDDPILISTYVVEDCVFAVVLRGKKVKSVFTTEEESKLEAVMPFISRSLLYSINIAKNDTQQKDPFETQLTDLLDSAALFSTQVNFEDLIKVIQERSIKMVNATSCRFLLYNHLTNQFLLDNGNLPGSTGLAGNVASFGSPIIISSPMSDSRFDNKIDLDVHQLQEIDSMLIVPVYSSFETVIGVLSLANQTKKPEFTSEDEKIIISIAQLSSISLQNAKIFKEYLEVTQKLNDFVRIKNEKNNESKNEDKSENESILLNILKKTCNESKAYRATLFLAKENTSNITDKSLLIYRSIGGPPEQGIKFSLPAAQQRKQISYPINDDFTERVTAPLSSRITRYSSYQAENTNPYPAPSSPPKTSKTGSISQATSDTKVDMGTSPSMNQSGRLICCTPIYDENSEIISILEIGGNSINTAEEIDLFQNFSNIVSLSIKNEALQDLINIRNEQFSLHETIPDSERELFTVPSIFKEKVPENVFTKDFDITKVDPQYLFNVAFLIFDKFGLMKEFKITASKLFLFLYKVKNLLKDEKDWRHSIEVACFISYLLITTKFDEKTNSYELLALFIASFCHDIKDTSLVQDISPLQETALDILYAKKSVFESFSCIKTFLLISSPDSNLLVNLAEDKIVACKELIIQLILSTDYYNHYSLLHDFKELVSNENVNLDSKINRLLVMKILLKCSDVGVIARVRNVADKYQDSICDEFFLHGPFDKAREIMFTSPLQKDRSHIDRKYSKKTVFDSVFAPMFRLLVKIFPQLNEILTCLNGNISRWAGKIDSNFSTDKNKLGPDRMLENE